MVQSDIDLVHLRDLTKCNKVIPSQVIKIWGYQFHHWQI